MNSFLKSMRETIDLMALREGKSTDLAAIGVSEAVDAISRGIDALAASSIDDALYEIDGDAGTGLQREKSELVSELRLLSARLHKLSTSTVKHAGLDNE